MMRSDICRPSSMMYRNSVSMVLDEALNLNSRVDKDSLCLIDNQGRAFDQVTHL